MFTEILFNKKRGVAIGRPKVTKEKLDIEVRMYKIWDCSVKETIKIN